MTKDAWEGCYSQGWGKDLVPESFSHPAKVSFKLAERIYQHALEQGWVEPGSIVLDCFAGISGFGLHAMLNGLHFIGVELEPRFVKLAEQNIALWQRKFKGLPGLGTARVVQGDSRELKKVVAGTDICISSPPYAESGAGNQGTQQRKAHSNFKFSGEKGDSYGHTPGQLGNMPEGKVGAIISSPPYAGDVVKARSSHLETGRLQEKGKIDQPYGVSRGKLIFEEYGKTEGQLGAMKEGSVDLVASSPPHGQTLNTKKQGQRQAEREKNLGRPVAYGDTPGQLADMPEGVALIASSPPYENSHQACSTDGAGQENVLDNWRTQSSSSYSEDRYNLGNATGSTFWSSARLILEQCHDLLKPGGHCIWVVKSYVKGGRIIDFPGNWRALCESVGFKMVCEHHALLKKRHGVQRTIDGQDKVIETKRVSFFRRLHEGKRPDLAIDWEVVLCMVKEDNENE